MAIRSIASAALAAALAASRLGVPRTAIAHALQNAAALPHRHQVVAEVMGEAVCGVITGPSFALDVARGLPTGGHVEYADDATLTRALQGRTEY